MMLTKHATGYARIEDYGLETKSDAYRPYRQPYQLE